MPTLLLRCSNNRALIVDPARSRDAHRVRADVRWRDFHKSAEERLAWIERRQRSAGRSALCRISARNRLVAKRRWDEATAAYERVCRLHPSDLQVRYHLAYPRFMQGGPAASMAEFSAPSGRGPPQCGYGRSRCCIWRARMISPDDDPRRSSLREDPGRLRAGKRRAPRACGLVTPYRPPKGTLDGRLPLAPASRPVLPLCRSRR